MRIFIIPALMIFLSCTQEFVTPLERNQFSEFTKYLEIKEFLYEAGRNSELISIIDSAETSSEKKIFLTKISLSNGVENKLKVLIIAQQHGNEQSGKEACLKLISEAGQGRINNIISNLDIFLIPQLNPDGSDIDNRRNSNDYDLNRDHLLLTQNETRFVQSFFRKNLPEAVLDIHEYYPYTKSWMDFGYLKNFDVQFGSVTNPNISDKIFNESDDFLIFIDQYLSDRDISHHKYIVGGPPDKRRIRYSTTDINDGRQSTGIYNTFSFILEGRNGKTSNDNLKRRTEIQFEAVKGWLAYLNNNHVKLKNTVMVSREKSARSDDSLTIRQDHFKKSENKYLTLKSAGTDKDTLFPVDNFHDEVKPLLKVSRPQAYLVKKEDKKLVDWLNRSKFELFPAGNINLNKIYGYKLLGAESSVDEELENVFAEVEKIRHRQINPDNYFYIPMNQVGSNQIGIAFEPQSMFGIVQYEEFKYLLEDGLYPILRIEQQ